MSSEDAAVTWKESHEAPPSEDVGSSEDEVITWASPSGGHDDLWTKVLRNFYFPFLVRHSGKVLIVWLITFVLCIIWGPAFLSSTKSNLDLPKGTPSAKAIDAFSKNYPELNSWPPAFVIMRSEVPGVSVKQAKAEAAANYVATYPTKFPKTVLSVTGYHSFLSMGLTILADRQISDDGLTTVMTVSFQKDTTLADIYSVSDDLLAWSRSYSDPAFSVYTTGIFPLFSEMQRQTSADFALIDEIVLPVCIVILGFTLRSYRHMAISLVNLALTILLAFGVLMPITAVVDINPFSPSILLSLGIAVCFDYSLFMLTRFKEERLVQKLSLQDAVFNMLENSGHVVLLSGSTLFTTFILLLIFPQNFLQSVGYTCSVVVLTAMLVNISVTPAMLLNYPCYSHFDPICFTLPHRNICCWVPQTLTPWEAADLRDSDFKQRAAVPANYLTRLAFLMLGGSLPPAALPVKDREVELLEENQGADTKDSGVREVEAVDASLSFNTTLVTASQPIGATNSNTLALADEGAPCEKPKGRSGWFLFSFYCTKHAKLILAIIIGITIPFFITFLNFTPTSDDYLVYLQTSRSLAGLKVMKSSFAEGRLDPYLTIITTGTPNGVLSQDYFTTESTLVTYLLEKQSKFLDPSGITGLTYFESATVSLADAVQYMDVTTTMGASSTGQAYRLFAASLMNSDRSSSMLRMELSVAPNSQTAVPYIRSVRNELEQLSSSPPVAGFPVKMYLFGGYTTTYDVQTTLFELVPIMIAVTVAIVLGLVGLSFGSVLVVLRLAFTVFVSLCWTYGLMVLVYQPGPSQRDFAVLTPSILMSSGIYWIIPVMSFSILVGLALDYDIFLMSRVVEFRRMGWSDRAAICLAIEKTAGVITAAGTIMSISFAGLLIPKTIVLNQYGFSLFLGVALDTFVVRTVLVPAVFTAFGSTTSNLNWWPGAMPAVVYQTVEEEDAALLAGLDAPVRKALPAALVAGDGDGEEGKA